MTEKSKVKLFSLRNPGLVMALIQLLIAAVIFIWFPTQPSAYGIALVGWLMVAAYIIWSIQTVIFIYWVELYENNAHK